MADGLRLPYRRECVDVCICVAVLHHFSTPQRRRQALREMLRILRCPSDVGVSGGVSGGGSGDSPASSHHQQGGKLLLYVWALEQGPKSKIKTIPMPFRVGDACDATTTTTTTTTTAAAATAGNGDDSCKDPATTRAEDDTCNPQQDVFVPWHLPATNTNANTTTTTTTTTTTNTTAQGSPPKETVFHRYYHLFRKGELEELVQQAAAEAHIPIATLHSGYDRDNWYTIVERI